MGPDMIKRLILILIAVCAAGLSPALAQSQQGAAAPPVESVQNVEAQLAEERENRREAEHKAALAEAKAAVMDAGNSRTALVIGMFGILITAVLAVAGYLTWKSAATAASTAAREEVRKEFAGIRDELDEIKAEAEQVKFGIDQMAQESKVRTDEIKELCDIARSTRSEQAVLTESQKDTLSEETNRIEQKPKTNRSGDDFKLLLLEAESEGRWDRYLDIANQMESAMADSPADLAHARFARARAYTWLERHDEAATAYQAYFDEHPDDVPENKRVAFNNWGNALLDQAEATTDPKNAAVLRILAVEKYEAALRIKPDYYAAFNNWGIALNQQAKAAANPDDADRLWTEAGEKYQAALHIKPDYQNALKNWGIALYAQGNAKDKAGDMAAAKRLYALAGEKFFSGRTD